MSVMQLGLGLGLAGAAGIRAYFPLIVMALLTRFAGTVTLRPSFRFLGVSPVLTVLAVLAAVEIMTEGLPAVRQANRVALLAGLRAFGGSVLFAGTCGSFGTLPGLILGAMLALAAHIIVVRWRGERGDVEGVGRSGAGESAAVAGTVLVLLLPWISFIIWGLILFVLVRRTKARKIRLWPEAKARSWR